MLDSTKTAKVVQIKIEAELIRKILLRDNQILLKIKSRKNRSRSRKIRNLRKTKKKNRGKKRVNRIPRPHHWGILR